MSSYDTTTQAEIPGQHSLQSWIESRVVRHDHLELDWDVLKFQADLDPKYRRAQMRYIGLGAAGATGDPSSLSPEHFTFTTMLLPAGHEFPPHLHSDVEEVFYLVQGAARFVVEKDGELVETQLGEKDLISVPPGVYRAIVSESDQDTLFVVVIGASKPERPVYPQGHPLNPNS